MARAHPLTAAPSTSPVHQRVAETPADHGGGRVILACRRAALMLGLLLGPAAAVVADASAPSVVALGITAEHLDAEFWIKRLDDADRVRLDPAAIARLNQSLRELDPSIHRLDTYAGALPAAEVRARIEALSTPLPEQRFGRDGQPFSVEQRAVLRDSLALDALAGTVIPQFGLVVRRAALRSYPTLQPSFSSPDDSDIDRLQESALFPGDAVVALHRSADANWLFVVAERYAAWIERDAVALGGRDEVLGYRQREPALIALGSRVQTVFAPASAHSQVHLEMGVQLPLRTDWPVTRPINGQLPLAHWVVDLPQHGSNGRLSFAPTLIARSERVATAPLPLTAANLIRQSFAFLGERYGWGHAMDGRDCSGFVSEVYRSLGIVLPRNTGDQARSPVFDTLRIDAGDATASRERALADADVGDLLHVPGHVMMLIGRIDGEPWLIHDAHRIHLAGADGKRVALPANGVVVTPLQGLLDSSGASLVERITHVQRIRPRATP